MGVMRVFAVGLAVLIAASCSGSSLFFPAIGPFRGEFMVEGEVIGNFNLTTTSGLLGGTGTLTHNDQPVNISISATIDGMEVSGTVSNASLGSGGISGLFADENNLSGQFNYQDKGGISTTTGTWTATTQPPDSD